MEFIWSHCDGKTNPYGVDYGSDESLDNKLKESLNKRGKPWREILADMDAKYELSKKEKEAKLINQLEETDVISIKSVYSNQSLLDFSPVETMTLQKWIKCILTISQYVDKVD